MSDAWPFVDKGLRFVVSPAQSLKHGC